MNNEINEKEYHDFEVKVTLVLEKQVAVPTNSYKSFVDNTQDIPTTIIDTDNIDWEKEYQNNCITISDLLLELKKYIFQELQSQETPMTRKRFLESILEASNGWKTKNIIVNEI